MGNKVQIYSELMEALRDHDEELALRLIADGALITDRTKARNLLELALDCSAELFDRILGICPEGDYALLKESIPLNWTGGDEPEERDWRNNDTNVYSKLIAPVLTVAAAMNKPDHVRVLLGRGFSPNADSLDSILAMIQESRRKKTTVHPEKSYVEFHRLKYSNEQGHIGVTPLAVALLYANPECVRVLLERKETERMENGTVAAMLMLPDREENFEYQKARKLVLSEGDGHIKMMTSGRNECRRWDCLEHAYAFRRCSIDQFKEELERCAYEPQEIMELGKVLTQTLLPEFDRDKIEKLLYLMENYPFIIEDESVQVELVFAAAREGNEELLYRCLGQNKTIKLGERAGNYIIDEKTITYLSQYAQIVVDRGALSAYYTSEKTLRTLLRYTTICPGDGKNLSWFARAVINTDSTPLLKWVLKNGYFKSEPIHATIEYAETTEKMPNGRVGVSFQNRLLLLAYLAENPTPFPPKRDQGDIRERMRTLLTNELEADEEREILHDWGQRNANLTLAVPLGDEELVSGWAEPLLAAFGKTKLLVEKLKDCPRQRHRSDFMIIRTHRDVKIEATVLCYAAMFGQISLMEGLLEQCADADELGCGGISFYIDRWKRMPMTPLMGAILRKQWKAAEFLLDRGAKLDLDSWAVKEFMRYVDEETREEVIPRLGKYLSRTREEN